MIKKVVYYSVLGGLMVSVLALSVNFNSDLKLLRYASAADSVPTAPVIGGSDTPDATGQTTVLNTTFNGVNPSTPSTPDAGTSGGVSTKKPPIVPTTDTTVNQDENWQLKNNTPETVQQPVVENPSPSIPTPTTINTTTKSTPTNTPRTGGLEVGVVIGLVVIALGVGYYYKRQHGSKSNLEMKEKKL